MIFVIMPVILSDSNHWMFQSALSVAMLTTLLNIQNNQNHVRNTVNVFFCVILHYCKATHKLNPHRLHVGRCAVARVDVIYRTMMGISLWVATCNALLIEQEINFTWKPALWYMVLCCVWVKGALTPFNLPQITTDILVQLTKFAVISKGVCNA
jgi:hypothetical protein